MKFVVISAVLALCIATVMSSPDHASYLEFIEKASLNETLAKEYAQYSDKRKASLEEKFFPEGNFVLGAPKYSCPTIGAKSESIPTNVNSLRLNDINVMAALGDSLTAGFGAGAHSLVELTLEYRGLAFPIGGDGDLKYSSTLPNIVSQYSNLVVGASTRVSPVWYKAFSQFNVAVSGARADNLTEQAHDLVARITSDNRVNMKEDWKLVTLFVGSNDLCHYCEDKTRYAPLRYKTQLKSAIDVLKAGLPRTLVQIISPHITQLQNVNKVSSYCTEMHKTACPCLTNPAVEGIQSEYQSLARTIPAEYADSDDFAVVAQTFMEQSKLPRDSNNEPDLSFFAPDCFHFSHWGHSLVSKGLFNNMLEPVAEKSTGYDIKTLELVCPLEACPLIRTAANSADCAKYLGHASSLKMNSFVANAPKHGVPTSFDVNNSGSGVPNAVTTVDSGSSFALICIGISLGLIVGLVAGSLIYHGMCTRRGYTVHVNEKTPLLGGQNGRNQEQGDNYVQIY